MSSVMARPDIPSIVVHNGSVSAPESPHLEQSPDSVSPSPDLSKQDSLTTEADIELPEPVDDPSTCTDVTVTDSHSVCTSPTPTTDPTETPAGPCLSPHQDVCKSLDLDVMAVGEHMDTVRCNSLELPHQRSQDSDTQISTRIKKTYGSKPKPLQRSQAMREDSSPPPETLEPSRSSSSPMQSSNNLMVTNSRSKKFHQRVSLNNISPVISRAFASLPADVYKEYENLTDSNGVQTVAFLVNTLCERPNDRHFLLKVEKECAFVLSNSRSYKFSQSSSYQRMLIHRVAALYQLSHNVDLVNSSCVIIERNSGSKEPPFKFTEILAEFSDDSKRQILKRQCTSCEDFACASDLRGGMENRRTKSYEEREEAYEKVRKRIFSDEVNSGEFLHRHTSEIPRTIYVGKHGSEFDCYKYHEGHKPRESRMHKYNSLDTQGSLDPRTMRPTVVKAFSFGGIGQQVPVLSRGDSDAGHPTPAILHKQDSQNSKTSDYTNSSGYKTRQISYDSSANVSAFSTTPSPTTIAPHPPFSQLGGMFGNDADAQPVLWAVTDMDAVPTGAMLINPQNGQPVCNKDGTVYKFDRSNPPAVEPSCRSRHAYESTEAEDRTADRKSRIEQQPTFSNQPVYLPNVITYPQESVSDLNGPMRAISIAGSASGSDGGSDAQPSAAPCVIPGSCASRPQSYQQSPVYYGPQIVSGTPTIAQGGKYMFPPVTSVPPPMMDSSNTIITQNMSAPATNPVTEVAMAPQPHFVNNYALVPVHPSGFVNPSADGGVYYPQTQPMHTQSAQPHNLIPAATNNQNYPIATGYFNAGSMGNPGIYASPQGVHGYQGNYYSTSHTIPTNQVLAPTGAVTPNSVQGLNGPTNYVGAAPRPGEQMVAPSYVILPPNNPQSQILMRPQLSMYPTEQPAPLMTFGAPHPQLTLPHYPLNSSHDFQNAVRSMKPYPVYHPVTQQVKLRETKRYSASYSAGPGHGPFRGGGSSNTKFKGTTNQPC